MKKIVLACTLLACMAVVAEAQVTLTYNRERKNSSLTITYTSGYGYGYGYGYGTGFGYGYRGFMPGAFVTTFSGIGHDGGYYYPGYYPYGLYGGGAPYHRSMAFTDYTPPPAPRVGGVPDRLHEFASAREIEEGRRRLKRGDYRGAVDEFRAAVTAHTGNTLAQGWFAVALVVTGDGRNADKNLRGVAGAYPAGKITLSDAFRDEREKARVTGLLEKVSGEGALSAAYALSLLGHPDRLKKLAEKDPIAAKLQ